MQLLEYLYGGSTIWHMNRVKRGLIEDTSITNPSLKTIGLMFRTVKPDGILIYAATNKHFTSVEVRCIFNHLFVLSLSLSIHIKIIYLKNIQFSRFFLTSCINSNINFKAIIKLNAF